MIEIIIFLKKKKEIFFERINGGDGKFIRLETGRYTSNYISNLIQLVDLLISTLKILNIELVIIAHREFSNYLECHTDIIRLVNLNYLKLVYFDKFDNDWKYPEIDWSSIINDC